MLTRHFAKVCDGPGLSVPFVELNRTVQSRFFFHQPAHPRGEGATIKRISPLRKPPAGGGG